MKLKNSLKKASRVVLPLVFCIVFYSSVMLIKEHNISDELEEFNTKEVIIPNYTSTKVYLTTDYLQSINGNTCGVTAATNILSYYKNARGLNLYSEDISQNIFDNICEDCNYLQNSGGPGYNKVSKGIKKFVNRAGFTCVVNTYWLRLFSDVKRDIDKGYPILMTFNNHAYVIVGYSEGGSYGNMIYVITGWPIETFQWLQVGDTLSVNYIGSINIH